LNQEINSTNIGELRSSGLLRSE